MRILRFVVNDMPPSNNENQGNGGKKAHLKYQTIKKMWAGYFQILRGRMEIPVDLSLPLKEATVITYHHYKTKARRDPDNYSGKMINDALKEAGVIKDDSFKEIEILPLATFGNGEKDWIEVYVIPGKRLGSLAESIIKGEM